MESVSQPPAKSRIEIVRQEIVLWTNTLYQQEIRYRVNVRIGSPEPVLEKIKAEMGRCEKALDMLREVMKELEKEVKSADGSEHISVPQPDE